MLYIRKCVNIKSYLLCEGNQLLADGDSGTIAISILTIIKPVSVISQSDWPIMGINDFIYLAECVTVPRDAEVANFMYMR